MTERDGRDGNAGAADGETGARDPAPYYRRHVFCCVNERKPGDARGCCSSRGGADLRKYMKDRAFALGLDGVRINQAGCLDRCEFGPALVVYPEGVWYAPRTEADIDEILETHLRDGGRVHRLMLAPDAPLP